MRPEVSKTFWEELRPCRTPKGDYLYVGLSGGIGSGKSTLARIWGGLGAKVLSADELARQVVDVDTPGLQAVVDHFGDQVLRPDGSLDRGALGAAVFQDPEQRRALEQITHPLIGQALLAELKGAQGTVVYEVPLLAELGMANQFDCVVMVSAPLETRISRLEARGLDETEARKRILAQVSDQERRQVANVWVQNGGDQRELELAAGQVFALFEHAAP